MNANVIKQRRFGQELKNRPLPDFASTMAVLIKFIVFRFIGHKVSRLFLLKSFFKLFISCRLLFVSLAVQLPPPPPLPLPELTMHTCRFLPGQSFDIFERFPNRAETLGSAAD